MNGSIVLGCEFGVKRGGRKWVEVFEWAYKFRSQIWVRRPKDYGYNVPMQEAFAPFPKSISRNALTRLRDNLSRRESVLQSMVSRFENQYNSSLDALEQRLAQGIGQEHPDWEDSIEWRNALDELQQADLMKRVLEWLLRSKQR